LNALEFPFERPLVVEPATVNHLYSAEFAQDISRQPNLAVAAGPNRAHHFVVGHDWYIFTVRPLIVNELGNLALSICGPRTGGRH
jgi:hypothetical protein